MCLYNKYNDDQRDKEDLQHDYLNGNKNLIIPTTSI